MQLSARSSPAASPRASRKGDLTAGRILDAAEELFAERGYAGTTLRQIATRVGLRNPSLYNHFPSKESLYAAVLERGLRPVLEALSEHTAGGGASSGDPHQLVGRMMRLLSARPSLPRLIQHETLSGGDHLGPALREWIEPILRRAREAVEANPAAGRWEADQIPLLVLAMYHAVVGYFTIAPFYRRIDGEDLLGEAALERQTRFLGELSRALLPNPPESTKRRAPATTRE